MGQSAQGGIPPPALPLGTPNPSGALLTSAWLGRGKPGSHCPEGEPSPGWPGFPSHSKGPRPRPLPTVYYEGLQDKLAQIRDARGALSALREEHREKLRRAAEEAERQRQIQLAQKLEIMRQKKQVWQGAPRRGCRGCGRGAQ